MCPFIGAFFALTVCVSVLFYTSLPAFMSCKVPLIFSSTNLIISSHTSRCQTNLELIVVWCGKKSAVYFLCTYDSVYLVLLVTECSFSLDWFWFTYQNIIGYKNVFHFWDFCSVPLMSLSFYVSTRLSSSQVKSWGLLLWHIQLCLCKDYISYSGTHVFIWMLPSLFVDLKRILQLFWLWCH